MINGKQFGWEDITIVAPQGTIINITEISYSDKKDVEEQYGKGSNPVGYGDGNYSAEGKMKIKREEHLLLTAALLAQGATSIYRHQPFPIIVSYANNDQVLPIVDTLRACKLTEQSGGPKQGDKSVEIELSFKILGGILWNGVEANA